MSTWTYLTSAAHWSGPGAGCALLALLGYGLLARPTRAQFTAAAAAAVLLVVALGSPLRDLQDLGLHAASMGAQILLLMIVPVLLLLAWPPRLASKLPGLGHAPGPVALAWLVGASVMWGGHLLSAAWLSARMGTPMCGISAQAGRWFAGVSPGELAPLLLLGGLLFALPVFHPDPARRLPAPQAVVYLFGSCVSCSLLGLWVTFSAIAAPAVPLAVAAGSIPALPSLRTDQELAGMLMWVPCCVLYVTVCARLLQEWMDSPPAAARLQTT